MSSIHPRRALVSVSDKHDLVPFVKGLIDIGFEVLSTGGTRKTLEEAGIPVIDVASYTEFPEMMDGRVKTLHPRVHGGLLGRPDVESDLQSMSEHGIVPFELVCVNLYPFEQTVARPEVTVPEAIEQIDIGGPSMVRSAAKNHRHVTIVTDPAQYTSVLEQLRNGTLDETMRRSLALAAFQMTARYDAAISAYLAKIVADEAGDPLAGRFPSSLCLPFQRQALLRYGENPHQAAAFYVEPNAPEWTLAGARQLHGKELSYNNLLDLDAALAIVRDFAGPACSIIKHNNPCGCGTAPDLATAFVRAYDGDPVSAFGSIIGFNRTVDEATALSLCEPNRFVESIIAPGFEEAAFEILTTRPSWKKNVRLMVCPDAPEQRTPMLEYRRVSGGLLIQDRDDAPENRLDWEVVTQREPTAAELEDLKFAWLVCKHVKSNAIVFAREGALVGVGAGQMSRLDSSQIASNKAGERSRGAVCGSDAFFPFRDGVDQAAIAGVTAIIQPGGSKRDDEVIAACNDHDIAMIFTGRRHFKH